MEKLITTISLLALLFLSPAANAANKWWDVNGAANGSGETTGSGTWNTSGLNWTTDATGNSAATSFATGDTAIFSAGTDATNAFTVNVPAAISAGGITVEEGTVSLTGAGVTLGTGSLTISNGAELSIPGSSTLPGTLGETIILNNGTLQNTATATAGSFVSSLININLNGGGTLSFPTVNILSIVQTNAVGTIISGTGPLTKTGAGVLAIATPSTYSGATIVNQGELRARTINNPLPVGTDLIINSPGIFNLNSVSQQVASLSGTGNLGTGAGTLTINGSPDTTFYGAISNICNAGASGVTSGNGKLTKTGASTITFAGKNDINGNVTLNNGGIIVLPGASLCGPVCDLFINGGTLTFSNAAQSIENLNGTGGTIFLGAGHTLTSSPSTNATNSSTITGPGGFIYSSTNSALVQTFNGTNTYTGTTLVTNGTLALGVTGSINKTASITLTAGSGLDVSAQAAFALGTNTTLIANGNGHTINLHGNIKGALGGTVSLGSQPITLYFNFPGDAGPALTISQGTLSLNGNPFTLNAPSPLPNGTNLIIFQNSGTILSSGTFSVTGTAISTNSVGSIQVTNNSVNLILTPLVTAQPGSFTSATILGDHSVQLNFSGSASQNYIVQATTNLIAPITWTNLSTNLSGTNGAFQYNDIGSTNFTYRFYRTTTP